MTTDGDGNVNQSHRRLFYSQGASTDQHLNCMSRHLRDIFFCLKRADELQRDPECHQKRKQKGLEKPVSVLERLLEFNVSTSSAAGSSKEER